MQSHALNSRLQAIYVWRIWVLILINKKNFTFLSWSPASNAGFKQNKTPAGQVPRVSNGCRDWEEATGTKSSDVSVAAPDQRLILSQLTEVRVKTKAMISQFMDLSLSVVLFYRKALIIETKPVGEDSCDSCDKHRGDALGACISKTCDVRRLPAQMKYCVYLGMLCSIETQNHQCHHSKTPTHPSKTYTANTNATDNDLILQWIHSSKTFQQRSCTDVLTQTNRLRKNSLSGSLLN